MSVHVAAEIGINHQGVLDTALRLIDAARQAGADSVKFQKRVPRLSVPQAQWDVPKETPAGIMPYIDYKEMLELPVTAYQMIDQYAKSVGIRWAASVWDIPSAEFIAGFDTPYVKVPSAKLTDWPLLEWLAANATNNVVISTGMSTLEEIDRAVEILHVRNLTICHCTSTYPCPLDELNLRVIHTLRERYPGFRIGYSGHEVGLAPTLAAVAMGATYVERHITLDRSMWGTDQASSVEPAGFTRMVKDIRNIERAMGDGVKRVYLSEMPSKVKLRG